MKTVRTLVAAAVLGAMAAAPATAGVLLGTGTLNDPDDLTRIQVGTSVLEFLDLTATDGSSVAAALGTYSPAGFHWATGAEVAELFGAFGMIYASSPNSVEPVAATATTRTTFVGYLGITGGSDAAIGWIDDLTAGGFSTYACVGINECDGGAFVNNTTFFAPPNADVGIYLVRDAGALAIPAPATAALLGLGLTGLGWTRRKPG